MVDGRRLRLSKRGRSSVVNAGISAPIGSGVSAAQCFKGLPFAFVQRAGEAYGMDMACDEGSSTVNAACS